MSGGRIQAVSGRVLGLLLTVMVVRCGRRFDQLGGGLQCLPGISPEPNRLPLVRGCGGGAAVTTPCQQQRSRPPPYGESCAACNLVYCTTALWFKLVGCLVSKQHVCVCQACACQPDTCAALVRTSRRDLVVCLWGLKLQRLFSCLSPACSTLSRVWGNLEGFQSEWSSNGLCMLSGG